MLLRFLGALARSGDRSKPLADAPRRLLNVGGYSRSIPLPAHFGGWEQVLLGNDRRAEPDIECDARDLASLPPEQFDAVYCSHHLELHHRLDGVNVLRGFLHVLKPGGFAQVIVSDLQEITRAVATAKVDPGTTLYRTPAGPIAVRDLIYGIGEGTGHAARAQFIPRTEFTPQSLCQTLARAGFAAMQAVVAPESFEITVFAFRSAPTMEQRELLNLPNG